MTNRAALLVVIFVALLAVQPALAQTATPTPEPPAMLLPQGWGPAGYLVIYQASGETTLLIRDELICSQGIQMSSVFKFSLQPPFLPLTSPPAVIRVRVMQAYGDGAPGMWPMRIRYAYWTSSNLGWDTDRFSSHEVKLYNQDGGWLSTEVAHYCPETFLGMPNYEHCDPEIDMPNDSRMPGGWRLFDRVVAVQDYPIIQIELEKSQPSPLLHPLDKGIVIASLYADRQSRPFPSDFCGQITPPTSTPWPTWTPTLIPSGTPTGTLTSAPTPLPTAPGVSATPTPTPRPYSTWTPQPTATAWQSPAPTLFPVTPTPFSTPTPYPTPSPGWALPTWAPWPTVIFPTLPPSVTPLASTAGLTITVEATPGAAATAIHDAGIGVRDLISFTDIFEAQADFSSVYSYTYDMGTKISLPLNLMRGLKPYMSNMYPHLAFVFSLVLLVILIQVIGGAAAVFEMVMWAIRWVLDILNDVTPG